MSDKISISEEQGILLLGGVIVLHVALLLFTYLSRVKGPGGILTFSWIIISLSVAGLGLVVEIPGISGVFAKWSGAVLVAISAIIAIYLLGLNRYLGERPWIVSRKSALTTILLLFGIVVAMHFLSAGYALLYEKIFDQPIPEQDVALLLKVESLLDLIWILLIVGLLVPFYEEVFFRGFLFGVFEKRFNPGGALVMTSFIFAIGHGILYAIPIFILGLALGWLRIKTGNIRLCILLHALNNSCAVLSMHFLEK